MQSAAIAVGVISLSLNIAPVRADAAGLDGEDSQAMYCLYCPESGEYFYTADKNEKDSLKQDGWEYKGIGWYAPLSSGTPVFRMYNPEADTHYFTASMVKRDYLVGEGWTNEGIGWYSSDGQEVPVYHQYSSEQEENSYRYAIIRQEDDGEDQDRTGTDQEAKEDETEWENGEIVWYGVHVDPDRMARDKKEAEEEISKDQESRNTQGADGGTSAEIDLTGAKDLGDFYLTAYCNPWGNPTASGAPTVANHTIAQNSLPFGSRVYIEGLGVYTVEDRGAASNGSHWIDVYCNTEQECYSLPVRNARVYLLP